jgi:chitinase
VDQETSATHEGVFLARRPTPEELAIIETSELLQGRDLFPRGARDRTLMALCGPGGQKSTIYVQAYPGAASILRNTGRAWTVAKQGLCAAAGITGLTKLSTDAKWVTEHVLEKQEFRNALQFMAEGKTASGTALRAGAVPFTQMFGANGIFQHDWPSANFPTLVFTRNWAGNINDFFTGLLGRTTDSGAANRFIDNLQVCDQDFNVYKEFMAAGKGFISDNTWGLYNHQEKVGILLDVVDMHNYRSQAEVVKAFSTTFQNIGTMFGDLTRYAATQGVNYNFKDAWEQIMPDYLNWQVKKMREVFDKYLAEEITFWGSSLAKNTYSPVVVKDVVDLLADLKTNMNTYLSLPVSQMTP